MSRTDRSGVCGASCALALATAVFLIAPCVAGAQSGAPATQAPPAQQPAPPAPAQDHWWERITFAGDFRLRGESFYQRDRPDRQRGRFRLRLGLSTTVADELRVGVRVASGDPADITSTNQSFTDVLSRKPLYIDLAYIAYTPKAAPALTLGAGKFPSPVARTQLTWDDDTNWEGLYEQLSFGRRGGPTLKLVAVQVPLNEVSAATDAFMFGEYAQVGLPIGRHAAQFSITNYAFRAVDQIAVAVDTRGLRNPNVNAVTRNAAGRVTGFLSEFNLVNLIGQITFATAKADYPVAGIVDYVKNTRAAADDDTGIWVSVTAGRAARPKTFSATYTFARIERDSVIGTFNFSDMTPSSNVRMNVIGFSYMPRAHVNLDFTGIFTKPILPDPGLPPELLNRLIFDARVSF